VSGGLWIWFWTRRCGGAEENAENGKRWEERQRGSGESSGPFLENAEEAEATETMA